MRAACLDFVSHVLQQVQKVLKKVLAHLQDHLECFLRPLGHFEIAKKDLKPFKLEIKKNANRNLFSIEGAPQFTEPLKQLYLEEQGLQVFLMPFEVMPSGHIVKPCNVSLFSVDP